MNERTYTLPGNMTSALVGSAATLDDLELLTRRDDALGVWACRTSTGARRQTLDKFLGTDPDLPFGLVASIGEDDEELDVVFGLQRPGEEWGLATVAGAHPRSLRRVSLEEDEVAFVFRHLDVPVILHPAVPLATMRGVDTITAGADVPPGALVYAVLDSVDPNAVLDLIAVSKGPHVSRRLNGEWHDDPTWASILRSPRPPKVAPVTGGLIDQVVSQVDESTKGAKFEPTDRAQFVSSTIASAHRQANETVLNVLPLLARASVDVGITAAMPPKLKKYWTVGKGAAKIRWGTPGAMTRCARYMRKYVGPGREYSTCNNLSKPLGGKGVAWDVG